MDVLRCESGNMNSIKGQREGKSEILPEHEHLNLPTEQTIWSKFRIYTVFRRYESLQTKTFNEKSATSQQDITHLHEH